MKYPKMTRCHFQFIADIIRESNPPVKNTKRECRQRMAEEFADQLYGTNNNFDRGRFMAACKEDNSK